MTPTRLQVVLDEEELAEIKDAAARERLTVAAWVRQALRRARADAAPALRAVVREATPRYGSQPRNSSQAFDQLEHALRELDGVDHDAEAAWDAEITRRLALMEDGTARTKSAEDVRRSINARFGW